MQWYRIELDRVDDLNMDTTTVEAQVDIRVIILLGRISTDHMFRRSGDSVRYCNHSTHFLRPQVLTVLSTHHSADMYDVIFRQLP